MKSKAIIEMPQGSFAKIEIKDGVAKVDRMLDIPVPISYGFIPNTLAEDGDPLDVFVLSSKYLQTLDKVDIDILGVFECTDQGVVDNKLFAKASDEKFTDGHVFRVLTEVGDYLLNYKSGFEIKKYRNTFNSKEKKELITKYWTNNEK